MKLLAIPPLLAAFTNISLIILVLLVLANNRKKGMIIAYILWNLAMAVWNLGSFAMYNARHLEEAYAYIHILMIGTLFIFPTTFGFILEFVNLKTRFHQFIRYLSYILCLLFIIMHYTTKSLSYYLLEFPWGYFPKAGWGDLAYGVTFFIFSTYSQILLFKLMRNASGQKKNQFRFIFWGTIVGYAGSITNFLPPLGINTYPLGHISTILYTLAVAYAFFIVRMLNLYYVIRRMALEAMTLLTIMVFCTILCLPIILFRLIPIWSMTGIFFIVVITLVLSNILYGNIRDMYFSIMFKYRQVFKRDISIWIKEIQSILTKKELFEDVLNMILKMFVVEKGVIKILEKKDILTATESNKQFGNVKMDSIQSNTELEKDVFMEYIVAHNELLNRDDIERKLDIGKSLAKDEQDLFNEMSIRGFSMLVPLKTSEHILGYILLGNRLSGNIYDKDEMDALLLIKDAVEASLHNIENVGIIKEQEKQLEEELQKANKLESLGILAGGIAHDFNNLLTVILGNVSLAKTTLDKKGELFEILTEAEFSARKAVGLSGQLSTFSKGGEPLKRVISITDQLNDIVTFASRGSKAKCSFDIQDKLWLVDVDESQFSRVINNIVINATQAMPFGGELNVSAENMVLNHENNIFKRSGDYVVIRIRDHGIGIPKEHLNKIFDPYFTTKETGTGLGLAIVYSIIKKHGGFIDVDSEPGKGTTFSLFFPASKEQLTSSQSVRDNNQIYSGTGKILVMDDDVSIQLMLKRMLSSLGYEVVHCGNGIEAIDIIKYAHSINKPFNVAIMDLTIQGGLGGKAAVTIIKQIEANIKAVVSSGYSNDDVLSNPGKYNFDGRISKPYTIEEISAVLGKLLKDGKRLN